MQPNALPAWQSFMMQKVGVTQSRDVDAESCWWWCYQVMLMMTLLIPVGDATVEVTLVMA
jgi:hypothetical protein